MFIDTNSHGDCAETICPHGTRSQALSRYAQLQPRTPASITIAPPSEGHPGSARRENNHVDFVRFDTCPDLQKQSTCCLMTDTDLATSAEHVISCNTVYCFHTSSRKCRPVQSLCHCLARRNCKITYIPECSVDANTCVEFIADTIKIASTILYHLT